MPVVHISGPDDPRVALYRHVPDGELLRAHGLFVAEGRFVVERLLSDRRFHVLSLLLNEAASRALQPVLADLGGQIDVFIGAPRDFEALTGHDIHRGCLALASRPAPLPLDELLENARSLIVLEEIANADNIGGVFRNAAAFDVDGVVLSRGCADPLYRKAIRTSMAATLRVPFSVAAVDDAWPQTLARLRAGGFSVVALTPREPARDLDEYARSTRHDRMALLLGAEGAGLSPEAEESADVCVRIGIRSDVDSLNVAVAAGIALHRLLPPAELREE